MSVLYTIGFTSWHAEGFFTALREHRVAKVVDVRLRNSSQLAGFAKRDDLRYFLRVICDAVYEHAPQLAPKADLLRDYRDQKVTWAEYEVAFGRILDQGTALQDLVADGVDRTCLLCSEHEPEHCHRRLVAERIAALSPNVSIVHLT